MYLFIILEFIIQDDSVGLVGLGPGEGDAVHGTTDLVHYRHSGRSCEETEESVNGMWQFPASVALQTKGAVCVINCRLDKHCGCGSYNTRCIQVHS